MTSSRLHRLTDAEIRSKKAQERDYTLIDGGGLYVFVRTYGEKEWFFRYTSPITKKRRKTSLGKYPDIGLQDARKIAAQKRALISEKRDPIIEDEKAQRRMAKEHQSLKRREQNTVIAVFEQWQRAELQNRKDDGVEIQRAFEKDVFPVVGKMPVNEITRQDIKNILDRPLKRGSKRMANRLLSDLKQFFGYIQDEELTDNDPTRRMFKSRVGGIEKPRERFLSEEERRVFANILQSSGLAENYQHALWIILSTCCRVDEISKAKWSHVNFDTKTFTIPASHAKNQKKHEIQLSNFTLTHFKALHETKSSPWIFPNRTGDGHIGRQTIGKQVRDRQRDTPIKGRVKHNNTLILPDGCWTPHDLRRTGATIMQELGVMPHIIKKCLNQTTDDPIMETYQRAQLSEMQAEAFDMLGNYLCNLQYPH